MKEKMRDMYNLAEELSGLSVQVSNLAKTISDSMSYSIGKSEPFYLS